MCSVDYFLGLGAYLLFMMGVLYCVYKLTERRMQYYKKVNFNYPLQLEKAPVYLKIVAGGIGAGLLQGIIGCGSGHMISLVLLSL